MAVDPARAAAQVDYAGRTYYFCCAGCADKFRAAPEKYLNTESAAHPDALVQLGPAAPGLAATSVAATEAVKLSWVTQS